ncbi:MAG: adenylate/guanylate cyclase domain-containing protein [Gammaproteobacteria bacterium]|nr:adenylate/guanylate cyclase domain-containing protein [Gammaproteobacteria bacterium]
MHNVSACYEFDFAHPAEKLWSVVADTPRWNEAAGVPKYTAREETQPDGSVKVFGQLSIVGRTIEWEELPVSWIQNRWFEQIRAFRNGPLRTLTARAQVTGRGERSVLSYEVELEPKNLLGTLIARRIVKQFGKDAARLLASAERALSAGQPDLFEVHTHLPKAARQRAREIAKKVEASPYGHGLAQHLVDYIVGAQEVDLWSMRPIALARRWRVEPRIAIELCLQAVRDGLLESRWDILCPRCRVSKASSFAMSDFPEGVHCPACNIDYDLDFAANVEITFSPSPAVRPVEYGHYCRTGPGATPHIKAQLTVQPGVRRALPALLAPGNYRLRTLEAGGELDVQWSGGGFPEVGVSGNAVYSDAVAAPGEIVLRNEGDSARTVLIEDRSWLRDVLTAERVTTLQAFRDLFSDQVLRPGDDVKIRNITFMFTDLVDSTTMFAEIGDAGAYHVVREHFSLLGDVAREYDGTIVKTIGDGIHAAFNTPDTAFRAAIAMQKKVAEFNSARGREKMAIRIGLHAGSSISVTLNGRLDYYGNTVNLAARLEGQGGAGEITMSQAFIDDAAVKPLLQHHDVRQRTVRLKGFDEELPVYQVTP